MKTKILGQELWTCICFLILYFYCSSSQPIKLTDCFNTLHGQALSGVVVPFRVKLVKDYIDCLDHCLSSQPTCHIAVVSIPQTLQISEKLCDLFTNHSPANIQSRSHSDTFVLNKKCFKKTSESQSEHLKSNKLRFSDRTFPELLVAERHKKLHSLFLKQYNNGLNPRSESQGQWTKWSPWSSCSVTCGQGMSGRTRVCRLCQGKKFEVEEEIHVCSLEKCTNSRGYGYPPFLHVQKSVESGSSIYVGQVYHPEQLNHHVNNGPEKGGRHAHVEPQYPAPTGNIPKFYVGPSPEYNVEVPQRKHKEIQGELYSGSKEDLYYFPGPVYEPTIDYNTAKRTRPYDSAVIDDSAKMDVPKFYVDAPDKVSGVQNFEAGLLVDPYYSAAGPAYKKKLNEVTSRIPYESSEVSDVDIPKFYVDSLSGINEVPQGFGGQIQLESDSGSNSNPYPDDFPTESNHHPLYPLEKAKQSHDQENKTKYPPYDKSHQLMEATSAASRTALQSETELFHSHEGYPPEERTGELVQMFEKYHSSGIYLSDKNSEPAGSPLGVSDLTGSIEHKYPPDNQDNIDKSINLVDFPKPEYKQNAIYSNKTSPKQDNIDPHQHHEYPPEEDSITGTVIPLHSLYSSKTIQSYPPGEDKNDITLSTDPKHKNTETGFGKKNGKWSEWGSWSVCSAECGTGSQHRKRHCILGVKCEGPSTENQLCPSEHECGYWISWGPWTPCSKTCGSGHRSRFRHCPIHKMCTTGASIENEICNEQDCYAPPHWTEWAPWLACNAKCGEGKKTRKRICSTHDGTHCPGEEYEHAPCYGTECWSEWNLWSSCSSSCGHGEMKRHRVCLNKTGCTGPMNEVKPCSAGTCPQEPSINYMKRLLYSSQRAGPGICQ